MSGRADDHFARSLPSYARRPSAPKDELGAGIREDAEPGRRSKVTALEGDGARR
jgi:hypothetical protein